MKNNNFYFKEITVKNDYKPLARHSHSMVKLGTSCLLVYGGLNDENHFIN